MDTVVQGGNTREKNYMGRTDKNKEKEKSVEENYFDVETQETT